MPRVTILPVVLKRSLADCWPCPLVESTGQIKNRRRRSRLSVLLERWRQDQDEESADRFVSLALHVDGTGGTIPESHGQLTPPQSAEPDHERRISPAFQCGHRRGESFSRLDSPARPETARRA